MTATVRLDNHLEATLNRISKMLNKKKSDVIRDAIAQYAERIETNRKSRILTAVEKTKKADGEAFRDFDGVAHDGL